LLRVWRSLNDEISITLLQNQAGTGVLPSSGSGSPVYFAFVEEKIRVRCHYIRYGSFIILAKVDVIFTGAAVAAISGN
jgi:hypothetical protein